MFRMMAMHWPLDVKLKHRADQEIITTEKESLPSDLDNLPANDPAKNPIHSDSFEDLTIANMDSQEDTQSESGDEKDRKELEEDQAAADRNAEMCGHPYSSTLQINNLEDAVYSVAPGEGNTPQYILMDHKYWHFLICFQLVEVVMIQ